MNDLDLSLSNLSRSFQGRNAKSCWRDNFRFPSPIYTQFDPVMHLTMALMSSKMSYLDLPLTYFSRSQCKISLAIYTQFDPVMLPTIDLNEFEDE